MTAVLQGARWIALAALMQFAGCATPPPADPADGPCAACDFSFRHCLEKDDFGPCSELRRYCLGWCGNARSCEEGCEGAMWGCEAAPTTRSTCNRIAEACPEFCAGPDGSEEAR